MKHNTADGDAKYELSYTGNSAPIFKRSVMRVSSSFFSTNYQQSNMAKCCVDFIEAHVI